jgi:biopolymer transport protein ExbB
VKRVVSAIGLTLLFAGAIPAAQDPMQALLESVRKDRIEEAREDQARERRFVEAHDQRRAMLESAREALSRERARAEQLSDAWTGRQTELNALRERHAEATGELGDLQVLFSRTAETMRETLATTLTALDHPDRLAAAEQLTRTDGMPATADLEVLWELMLGEAIATGEVSRFPSPVVDGTGVTREGTVVRAGDFSVVSNGKYLRRDPRTGGLAEAGTQPRASVQRVAAGFEEATETAPLAVDPQRGAALAALQGRPDWTTRIRQGGVIGYLIIALGFAGLFLTIERWVSLSRTGRRMERQRSRDVPDSENPLGRLLRVRDDPGIPDPETLALQLDEVILAELPRLRRGLGALSVIAAVAPLLGLLGTVTGIIETFQSLTQFGAGDPRMLSGGISLALVTTVMGLIVAIPLVMSHSVLSAKSNALIQALDETSAAIVADFSKGRRGAGLV